MLLERREEQALYQEIVSRIVAVADPEKVIVFGSRARGTHRPDSDIDLLIIKDSLEPRHKRAVPIYAVLSDLLVGMDILVYTPREAQAWSNTPQSFVATALREGKLLYERAR